MGRGFYNFRLMGCTAAFVLMAAFVATAAIAQGVAEQDAAEQAAPAGLQRPSNPVPLTAEQQAAYRKQREEQLLIALDTTFMHQSRLTPPGVKPEEIGSIVLTMWEHLLIEEWRNTEHINTSPPSMDQVKDVGNTLRELSLGGIVFKGRDDWTVWLNGQRLRPNALPKEVMDINVGRKHVELKWYDASTNLIYPIRLRPHQRFNLDSRMFLPGTPPVEMPADQNLQ